jgi:sialate O-acetylesterase
MEVLLSSGNRDMNCSKPWRLLLVSLASAWLMWANAQSVRADVKLPALFTHHMVIQRDKPIVVWGWADAGEDVTVSLGEASAKVKADGEGNWKTALPAMKSDGKTHILKIAGKNTVAIEDVLLGEV